MDVEVLRVGVALAEAEMRPEEDQSGPAGVECPAAKEEEEGRSSLRFEGGCSSAWLVEANPRAAAPAVGGASGRFTSVAERGRGRWRWCWRFEKTLLLTEDKAQDKDSGGVRGRWSPTAHDHHPQCRAGARAVTGASD
jgi:hypothetical protein